MHRPVVATLCAALATCASVRADEISLAPREGVLLLANGELIAGKIIPAGDRYDVHLANGEISLRRADVALICRDADECYRHKRNDIELGRVQDHLDLAEWCIRNKLYAAAERELADARSADPMHPKLRLVASRLALAKQPPAGGPVSVVEQAVAYMPLDTLARNLPPGTMETFTNSVQPLLLNYCSKSGCHSSRNDGGLKLERVHPRFSGRSTTQRNLERVLTLIDRENPSASQLLQCESVLTERSRRRSSPIASTASIASWCNGPMPWRALGCRSKSPRLKIARRRCCNRFLREWSRSPGDRPAEPISAESAAGEMPLPADLQGELPLPTEPGDPGDLPPPSSADQAFTPEQLRSLGIDPNAPGPNVGVGVSQVQRGAKLPAAFTPKDEFDPEIFNRRFFGQ